MERYTYRVAHVNTIPKSAMFAPFSDRIGAIYNLERGLVHSYHFCAWEEFPINCWGIVRVDEYARRLNPFTY